MFVELKVTTAEDLAALDAVIPPWAAASIAKAKLNGIVDWSNPNQLCDMGLIDTILDRLGMPMLPSLMTPDVFEATLYSLGALTSISGLTKARLIVALDRMGKLKKSS